ELQHPPDPGIARNDGAQRAVGLAERPGQPEEELHPRAVEVVDAAEIDDQPGGRRRARPRQRAEDRVRVREVDLTADASNRDAVPDGELDVRDLGHAPVPSRRNRRRMCTRVPDAVFRTSTASISAWLKSRPWPRSTPGPPSF